MKTSLLRCVLCRQGYFSNFKRIKFKMLSLVTHAKLVIKLHNFFLVCSPMYLYLKQEQFEQQIVDQTKHEHRLYGIEQPPFTFGYLNLFHSMCVTIRNKDNMLYRMYWVWGETILRSSTSVLLYIIPCILIKEWLKSHNK